MARIVVRGADAVAGGVVLSGEVDGVCVGVRAGDEEAAPRDEETQLWAWGRRLAVAAGVDPEALPFAVEDARGG